MELNKNKVAVGLSGGVDSTTAAYLLKEEGYEVIGITMVLFDEYDDKGNKTEPKFVSEAKRVARVLGIPHYIAEFREPFENIVKKEFVEEYLKGKTPNPCVTCNKYIKYGRMIEYAHSLGAYYFATGHYANVKYDSNINKYRIFKGLVERKDQSYMLHSLSQEQLKHVIFPLGGFDSKEEVRKLALEIDPLIANKTDSTDICFIPDKNYPAFIASYDSFALQEGDFVDLQGRVIGKHSGIVNYTIGQKRKLGQYFPEPKFVVAINAEKNEVVLGEDKDTYSSGLIACNANFTIFDKLEKEIKATAKVCQWGWYLPVTIKLIEDDKIMVTFDKKERAIAVGQAVVFYQDNEIIGGAKIESVIK